MKNSDKKLKKIKAAVAASSQAQDKFDKFNIVPYLAGFGLICAIYLCHVYYLANFAPDASHSLCHINETFDCEAVARGKFALLFGIPNSLWGVFMYGVILLLYYAKSLKEIKLFKFMEVFPHPRSYIYLISLLATVVAVCLLGITAYTKQVCIVCCITWLIDISLFICCISKVSPIDHIINAMNDFFKAITNKWYAVSFSLILILFISVLNVVDKKQPFVPEVTRVMNELKDFQVTGNDLGSENAKVVINEYTDLQCPFCSYSNLLMNKIVKEYDNVRVIHHDFPLDVECNKKLTQQMHPNSCLYSQYVLAAKKQNKFWDLTNKLFRERFEENNKPLSEEKVLEYASELGIDTEQLKKDAYSDEIKKQLEKEVNDAIEKGFNGTPTYIIGDKQYSGLSYENLEKIVTDLGAVKRR